MRKSVVRSIAGRLSRAGALAALLSGWICTQEMRAVSVVDANNQVIYEIIEGTQTVEISSTQSQSSNNGTLVLPKTVTDENTESVNYGKTFTVVAMQPRAFQNCPIEAVIIEAEIPEIPESAFNGCYNMKSLTLPETITKFDKYSFQGCSSLTSVVTCPNLEVIGNYAFAYCGAMTEFNLAASTRLHTIGESAFYYCSNMPFPAFPALETLSIGRSAFSSCNKLGKVVIPQNAQIGRQSFASSTITELTFPTEGNWRFGIPEDGGQPGWFVFNYATLPETVIIPSSANVVPNYAFESCYGLKTLVIEDNPELVVGENACLRSSSLQAVEFKGKVKSIEKSAFENTGLKAIALPPCEKLGARAFANNYNLADISFPDTEIPLILSDLFIDCSSITEAVLPDWMKEVPVSIFQDCYSLKTVTFPLNLEIIREEAFSGTALELPEENSLPASLRKISTLAFNGVSTIGKIALPASLEYISIRAFANCSNLQISNFDQLSALKKVGEGAFMNCTSLTSIKFPANLELVGANVTGYPYDNKTLGSFQGCANLTNVEFNPGVQLGVNCFAYSGIKEINWPEGMTIQQGAFHDCNNLSKVTIPGHITKIPNDAFYYCRGLTTATVEDGVEIIGHRAFMNTPLQGGSGYKTVKEIQKGAFANTAGAFNGLPPNVEKVGDFAFWRAGIGPSFQLNDKVKSIDDCAFCGNHIRNVTFPEFPDADIDAIIKERKLPIEFGSAVFANNAFTHVELPRWMVIVPYGMFEQKVDDQSYKMYDMGVDGSWYWPRPNTIEDYPDRREMLETVVFAPGTVEIEGHAFNNNLHLRIGDFPSTITKFGPSSFENCGSTLTTEDVTDAEGNVTTQELYLGRLVAADNCEFGMSAFSNAKLQSIEFQGCAKFDQSALANMKYISEIEFPECMTEIPAGFCKGWSILEKVRFKNNKVVKILAEAFSECPKLNGELDLSKLDDLVEIGSKAFMNTPVTSVKWPSGEFTLGANAFQKCQLTEVVIPKNVYNIGAGCFQGNPALNSVKFENRTDDRLLSIGAHCFRNNNVLKEITLPNTNISLGANTFYDCRNLQTVNWPADDKKVTLGTGVFKYCRSLKMERLHPSIEVVPDTTFGWCNSLVDIELPSVKQINQQAFRDCEKLNSVSIGGDIHTLGDYGFFHCGALTAIYMPIAPIYIGMNAFNCCEKLKSFEVADTEVQKTETVKLGAFFRCFELENIPDIFSPAGVIYDEAFSQCIKLKSLRIPPFFYNTFRQNDRLHLTSRFAANHQLQSIEFLYDPSRYIRIYRDDFSAKASNPNFKALSYFRGDIPYDRIYYSETQKFDFYNTSDQQLKRYVQPIKLMVSRGQKSKFVDKGFESLNAGGYKYFDIEEIKEPVMELHGEIFSKFDVGTDINQYTGIIRWQLELSDLDSEKPTEFELMRDGNKVARIVFDAPVLVQEGVSDGSVSTSDPIYSVAYHAYDLDGNDVTADRILYGDFYYEASENRYTHTVQTAQKNVYFNGSSTARIGQADLGRKSWFLYKDRFDSPRLDGIGIPVSHTYVLRMKNYDYKEWENYPDLIPDADGNYYRKVAKRTGKPGEEWMESAPCVVHTSIAHPSIAVEGLYDKAQVIADTDRSLAVTTVPDNASYAISYVVPGNSVEHKLDDGTYEGSYIVQSTQAYKLADRSDLTSENSKWGAAAEIKGKATGVLSGPDVNIVPNQTAFQTVTDAGYRGTFGSPKVSLYGAPELEISTSVNTDEEMHIHFNGPWCRDWQIAREYKVNIAPLLEKFGYQNLKDLSADKYFIGLWRSQSSVEVDPLALSNGLQEARAAALEPVLIWHSDGLHPQEYQETCDVCSHVGFDPATMVYTDRVECPNVTQTTVNYTARLYVQKPDDPNKYGVAEAAASNSERVVAGIDNPIEDVSVADLEKILAEGELFNLQGVKIERPDAGAVFIAVYNGKPMKLRMTR